MGFSTKLHGFYRANKRNLIGLYKENASKLLRSWRTEVQSFGLSTIFGMCRVCLHLPNISSLCRLDQLSLIDFYDVHTYNSNKDWFWRDLFLFSFSERIHSQLTVYELMESRLSRGRFICLTGTSYMSQSNISFKIKQSHFKWKLIFAQTDFITRQGGLLAFW